MNKSLLVALSAAAAMSATPAFADEAKGKEIATEVQKRDEGWANSKSEAEMILRNRSGQESIRKMKMDAFEVDGDGDKSKITFVEPKDVKDTTMLTHSHTKGNDDQWICLPALKRVKRISSRNKSGPFMGSEFAYEDLASQEVEKYNYKYIKDDTLNGQDMFVVERYPTDRYTGYSKQISWINKAEYRIEKVEFYDRKKSKLKTLEFLEWNKYLDKHWRPGRMEMVNHQTGKSTTLKISNYQFQAGLRDSDFNKGAMRRCR